MTWTAVKGHVKNLSERDLLALIQDLYKLDPKNKRFLESKFLTLQRAEIIKDLKDKIFRNIMRHENLRECRTLINNYKKSTGCLIGYIDFCIWHTNCIVAFIEEFGGCGEDMERSGATSNEATCISYEMLNVKDQDKVYHEFLDVVTKAKPTGSCLYEACNDYFSLYINNKKESQLCR